MRVEDAKCVDALVRNPSQRGLVVLALSQIVVRLPPSESVLVGALLRPLRPALSQSGLASMARLSGDAKWISIAF